MEEPAAPSGIDRLADLLVFGPIGLWSDAGTVLPQLAAKGRATVRHQVTLARVIGQFAVAEGERRLGSWADRQRAQGAARATTARSSAPEGGSEPASPAAHHDEHVVHVTRGDGTPRVDDLALADYDTLAAAQVIARLGELSAPERDAIARYERAHRGRKTILGKIAQLS